MYMRMPRILDPAPARNFSKQLTQKDKALQTRDILLQKLAHHLKPEEQAQLQLD